MMGRSSLSRSGHPLCPGEAGAVLLVANSCGKDDKQKRASLTSALPLRAIRSSTASSSNLAERELRASVDFPGRRFGRPVANKRKKAPHCGAFMGRAGLEPAFFGL